MTWFALLALLGALHVAALSFPLLSHLALCLGRPKDLRRRYGAWAVITGPTSGMGRSTAVELARKGMNLVLVGRNPAKLRDISAAISKAAPAVQTKTVVFDLSLVATAQRDEAIQLLRRTVEELDVGVLVNNAGVLEPPAAFLHEADVEAWVDMIRVNLLALTEVTAAVIPGMVERGRGAVVNFGSMSSEALPSLPLYTMYAATKRYVAHFSKCLHVEYSSKGIDVQCQVPFFVTGAMASGFPEAKLFASLTPTPDEFARAAVRWIGQGALCVPNLRHQIAWCIAYVLPDWLLEGLLLREHLWQRKELQRMRPLPHAPVGTRDLISYTCTSGCLN
ncbi:very-long-chain 3-oxoacyl-CoA reductase 1-like [Hordeum vulgare subsp. vulgare]|uniref:Putative b-keto acyl reductase n=1 Tax=Hordeum vulgare subsp. vulgare TaxID=112509 RepID=A1C0M0_HORVV|nr:very-long-chain 3-oxoacyl-CoA reductase 1-like [Hordeum vulgare subsp. vulgare]ABL11231.1 putative b-keto acyl reductase [Hordeum vulgare subsp. vulgare]